MPPPLPSVKMVKTTVASVEIILPLATFVVAVAAVVAVVVVVSKFPGGGKPIADAAVVETVLFFAMVFVHPVELLSPNSSAMGRSLTNGSKCSIDEVFGGGPC